MARLFLLFTLMPVLELYLLIRIGRVIGAWDTILFVILVGMFGAYMAQSQGRRVIAEWQSALSEQRVPTEGVLSGLLVFVGGLLLVTPGVLTDLCGVLLLVPFTRKLAASWLRRYVEAQIAQGRVRVYSSGEPPSAPFGPAHRPRGRPGPQPSARPGPRSHPGAERFDPRFGTVIDTDGERVD